MADGIKKIDVDGVLHWLRSLRWPRLSRVVQSSNGNFIIVHPSRDDDRVHLISEVSIDGTKIIRSFDPRSIELNELKDWSPRHLSIYEDDNIFVADFRNDRVVLLNPRLDEHQIFCEPRSTSDRWTIETLLRTRETNVDRSSGWVIVSFVVYCF